MDLPVSYGSFGLVYPTKKGQVVSRQNVLPELQDKGTQKLIPPEWVAPTSNRSTLSSLLGPEAVIADIEWIPTQLLNDMNHESGTLLSEGVMDPTIGSLVALGETKDTIIYADDQTVNWIHENCLQASLQMQSKVLQVMPGYARTRQGLVSVDPNGYSLLYRGSTMDAAPNNEKAVLLSPRGQVMIVDANKEISLSVKLSQGTKSGWGRVHWYDNCILWANRRQIAMLDPRSPDEVDRHIILDLPDGIRDVQDVTIRPNNTGHDAFALTSTHVSWLDLRMNRSVFSWEHFFASKDYSSALHAADYRGGTLLSVTSQIHNYSVLYTLGTSKIDSQRVPVSLCDPYVVPTWPTVMPSGQVIVETEKGADFYMTVSDGGLYRQVLADEDSALGSESRSEASDSTDSTDSADSTDFAESRSHSGSGSESATESAVRASANANVDTKTPANGADVQAEGEGANGVNEAEAASDGSDSVFEIVSDDEIYEEVISDREVDEAEAEFDAEVVEYVEKPEFEVKPPSKFPQPDPPLTEPEQVDQVDFNLQGYTPNSMHLRLDNMYKWIFDLQQPTLKKPAPKRDNILPYLGYTNEFEAEEYLREMYVESIREKAPSFVHRREEAIDQMVSDVAAIQYEKSAELPQLGETCELVSKLRQDWPTNSDIHTQTQLESQDIFAMQPVSATQPGGGVATQPVAGASQSFSGHDDISFSQPLPALRSVPKKAKKTKSKKKRKDGFG